ncbi:hypothetical protein C0995_007258 [Termitomyces sp. Mi166|nr:hypothetical protein C0995_007258 [Termitomyces sp. Mi166\
MGIGFLGHAQPHSSVPQEAGNTCLQAMRGVVRSSPLWLRLFERRKKLVTLTARGDSQVLPFCPKTSGAPVVFAFGDEVFQAARVNL